MEREWRDPRDGTTWRVDALPFDVGDRIDVGWTLVFVSNDHYRVLPVGYQLGAELDGLAETLLMALLDAAAPERPPPCAAHLAHPANPHIQLA